MLRRIALWGWLLVAAPAVPLAGGGPIHVTPAAAAPAACSAPGALGYDFEDGADGFTAPGWLAANAGQPAQSTGQVAHGTYSLALPVRFTGGGFEQAGVDRVLDNYNAVDLSGYAAVQFDVYAPVASLFADFVFNDPWNPPVGMRKLTPGWNTVTYDLSPGSADFPGQSFTDAREFLIRVVGERATYSGPVYVDDVRFVPSTTPILHVQAPEQDSTISVPEGQAYAVSAQVCPAAGRTIASVRFQAQRQSGALAYDAATGLWIGQWDLWREGDGLRTLSVGATDSAGASASTSFSVLVKDSGLGVHIANPGFDQVLQGSVTVAAVITPDPRFGLPGVQLQAGGATQPMELSPRSDGPYLASARLETPRLDDGVQTLRVVASDSRFTVSDLVDVQVQNHRQPWDVVGVRGSSFIAGGAPFRYVGWNEYDLFTRTDQTIAHLQLTGEGTVLQKGTVRTWQEQIDRQMLEAERRHLDVLRTWAFDENHESVAFQPGPGQYNEAAFTRLDYIMASARKHHIRVILTLANYWPDYGGIGSYASWLGLPNKLLFFTDARAQDLYRRYVAHIVNRVNTVDGIAYKDDPTVFAWELMNEPRSDCADDPTPDHRYCDPSGSTVRSWISTMGAYVKQLDPEHMVATGGEGHGFVPTGSGGQGIQWARDNEGDGNAPYLVQNVPQVDFFTFHPYPNASWARFTAQTTQQLVTALTRVGVSLGKPTVMEEYGIDRQQPLYDLDGHLLSPADPRYPAVRVQWYQFMLDDVYGSRGAGSNIWQLADWHDNSYNVNLYLPGPDTARDAPLASALAQEAERVGRPPS